MTQNGERAELLQCAIRAAHEAGKMTLRYFRSDLLTVEKKKDHSPVTDADRSAEEWLRSFLGKEFPDFAILGEEFGEKKGTGRYRWILDPIDGTKSFVCGVPFYGTMVALEDTVEKDSVLGVVHFPAMGEMIWASSGDGAFVNGRRVRVSDVSSVNEAVLLASDIRGSLEGVYAALVRQLLPEVKWSRTWGDCYGHYLVATGRAEIMVDPKLSLWDVAPLKPILVESGGALFDHTGSDSMYMTDAIGCNAALSPVIKKRLGVR